MLAMLFGMVLGPTDEELVRRFKDGDRHAFNEIVRRYQSRVFSLCLRWMGDRQIAEEVAQDVFIATFKALGRFRGDAKLSTWIFRVTVNHCKNRRLYRKRRHQDRHEALEGNNRDDPEAPNRQLADEDAPSPDALRHQSEADTILADALAALDDDQREIIVLRDVEDLSYEEIADLLELPRGTVKSRLHRARKELARKLKGRITVADVV
ncbi:MAG: sigma-70 family RNA polymerase sigma factor [Alphaproteobacteria bacterium]|nr:sigma-70 family RNA polymerase sigma factor [Alphaproteobacteria bacterium]MCB9793004.1 sigma-70 family RNA polymerase sigma factor [Alphaproteobacteria bacterium]